MIPPWSALSRRGFATALGVASVTTVTYIGTRTPPVEAKEERQSPKSDIKGTQVATYPANNPIEDRHIVGRDRNVTVAAVFDGHGGWQCSEFVSQRLYTTLHNEFAISHNPHTTSTTGLRAAAEGSLPGQAERWERAIVRAFERVDREFYAHVKAAWSVGYEHTARTGSCGLVCVLTPKVAYVGCAGDSRAVLGRRTTTKTETTTKTGTGSGMEAVELSIEHNARLPHQQRLLETAHPGEVDIVRCKPNNPDACYVKGRLQPTRAFGDLYLKFSEFNGTSKQERWRGRFIPAPYTPPYITATPELQRHVIDPSRDEFIILASDGLWDYVSPSEAVDIAFAAPDGQAAEMLVEESLARAATKYQLSVSGLKALPQGPSRRSKHDDVTCIVLALPGHVGGDDDVDE